MAALATVEGLDEEGGLGGHQTSAATSAKNPDRNRQAAVRIDYAPNPHQ
jgi:hypothetical protein